MNAQRITRSLPTVCVLLVVGIAFAIPARAVTLKEEVRVEIPPFTLQNVTEESLKGEFARLQLGRLPRPGQSRHISGAYIKMKARSKGMDVPTFQGSIDRVSIVRPSRTIGSDELKQKVRSVLEEDLAVTDSVEIAVHEVPDEMEILPGPYSLKLKGWNPYRKERGRTNYRVKVVQKGEDIRQFRVTASVTQRNRVPVATEPIDRDQTISEDLITWKEREISALDGNIIRDRDRVIGFKAANRIRPGDIITGGEVKRPILVERRSPVTIVVRRDGFKVTAKGEALEKGARGDRIMVENRSSEVQIRAEVIGERRVLIRDES